MKYPAIIISALFVPALMGQEGLIPTTSSPSATSSESEQGVDPKKALEDLEKLKPEDEKGYKESNLEEKRNTEGQTGTETHTPPPPPPGVGPRLIPTPPSSEEFKEKIRSRPRQIKKRKGELTP